MESVVGVVRRPVAAFLHAPAWTTPVAGIIAAVALASGMLRAVAQGTQAFTTFVISAAGEGFAKVVALAAFVGPEGV